MKNTSANKTHAPLAIRILKGIDSVVFSALLTAAVWIPFRGTAKITLACTLVFFSAALLLVWLDRTDRKRRERMRRSEAERAIRTERLLLLSDEEIRSALHMSDLIFIRRTDAGESDLLAAIKRRPACIAVPCETQSFRALLDTHAPQIRLIGLDELLCAAPVSCSEEEIDSRLHTAGKRLKWRFRPRALLHAGSFRLFALGILLLVLSLVWRYKIYYRLLSSACFTASVISGAFDARRSRRNFAIFLDNRGK